MHIDTKSGEIKACDVKSGEITSYYVKLGEIKAYNNVNCEVSWQIKLWCENLGDLLFFKDLRNFRHRDFGKK